MKEKVSIIIPVYNAEKYLDRCIDSVLKQTYKNLEIILIDDGSTDRSKEICKKYESKDSRIVLICKKNSGVSDARNLGINKATGKYIYFLDSDDFIDLTIIENLLKIYNGNSLVGVRNKVIYNTKEIIEERLDKYSSAEFFKSIFQNKINGYCVPFLYNKGKCVKFNKNIGYCEDIIFLYEYIKTNKIDEIVFINEECYYNYCVNEMSTTQSSDKLLFKIDSLFESMNYLNKLSKYAYEKDINNKLVYLFEAELQKCSNNKERLIEIFDKYTSLDYDGKKLRYTIFVHLYNKRRIFLLKIYYLARRIVKNIREVL